MLQHVSCCARDVLTFIWLVINTKSSSKIKGRPKGFINKQCTYIKILHIKQFIVPINVYCWNTQFLSWTILINDCSFRPYIRGSAKCYASFHLNICEVMMQVKCYERVNKLPMHYEDLWLTCSFVCFHNVIKTLLCGFDPDIKFY